MKKYYLRDQNNNPVTLVAYDFDEEFIYFSTATKHPKDKFDRSLCHKIVEGRLGTRPTVISLDKNKTVLNTIINYLSKNGSHIEKKAAKVSLEKFHTKNN